MHASCSTLYGFGPFPLMMLVVVVGQKMLLGLHDSSLAGAATARE